MLLIAVTGPVGAGKTTLLARLADWAAARGRSVEGFVARAEGARSPGAERYTLAFLDGRPSATVAERPAGPGTPFVFHDAAFGAARAWAEALPARPWLVVLDEFGRLEADGDGLMPVWPLVEAAQPSVAVLAVRADALPAVEARLGRRFDRVVRADDPGAETALHALCLEHDDWARVGVFGAGAGGVEVSVGAALHGARVPLRGLVMSSTQAAVMTEAARRLGRRERVVWVPFLAAGLKALSPVGSRLRPMLAITVQGLLYGAAVRVLGWNGPAVFVAGALVGAWAVLQGLVIQWLLVGEELLRAYDAVVAFADARLGLGLPGLAAALALLAASWAAVAGGVAWGVFRRERLPARITEALARGAARVPTAAPAGRRAALRGGLADLARPTFWVPVALILLLLALAGSPAERLLWTAARALTVGFLLLVGARLVAPQALLDRLRRRGVWGPAVAFAEAAAPRPPADPPD